MTNAHGLWLVLLLFIAPVQAQFCGDCDLDGVFPTIIDALTAAQIATGAVLPTPPQTGSCDVDASHSITVVDALHLAPAAGLLPVPLTTPIPGNPAPTPWEAARYHSRSMIEQLGCMESFLLVVFDTTTTFWRPQAELATLANRQAARTWLDGQNPTGGGAASSTAVDAALYLHAAPVDLVVLMSDGEPDLGVSEVAAVTAVNGAQASIDTHSFGGVSGVPLAIMADIATGNGGVSITVP